MRVASEKSAPPPADLAAKFTAIDAPPNADRAAVKERRERTRRSPNRLRHTRAAQLRAEYGIEPTRPAPGHSDAGASVIDAKRDLAAERVTREAGRAARRALTGGCVAGGDGCAAVT